MPIEMIAVQNPDIRKAVNTLYELSADDKVRAEYEMRQKAWRDRRSEIEGAWDDGRQTGILEIARKMKTRGRPLEEIAEDTGLSMTQINDL